MQDFYVSNARVNVFGQPATFSAVFDGHGAHGDVVAHFCSRRLVELVAEEMSTLLRGPLLEAGKRAHMIQTALTRAFERCHEELASKNPEAAAESGSTSICSLLIHQMPQQAHQANGRELWIANCGDSRAVIGRRIGYEQIRLGFETPEQEPPTIVAKMEGVPLTDDHSPDSAAERLRIVNELGGTIYNIMGVSRVMGTLALTRAIGDCYMSPYIIPTPQVVCYTVNPGDEFLVLATDGIWNYISNQDTVSVVRRTMEAVARRSNDHNSSGPKYSRVPTQQTMLRVAARALGRHVIDNLDGADNVAIVLVDIANSA